MVADEGTVFEARCAGADVLMPLLFVLIALLYPAGLALAAYLQLQDGPRALFDQVYMMMTLVVVPALLMALVIVMARKPGAPRWTVTGSLGLWIVFVTFVHFAVIGRIAAAI